MKKAIFMLLFGNNIYITGACIAAHIHRQFIKKYDLDIDLVLMIDKSINIEYGNELKKFFNRIIEIDLFILKLHSDYLLLGKYQWLKYALNKWQILKFTEYDKILFIDIDVLPIDNKLYNVFELETPSFICQGLNELREIKKEELLDNIEIDNYSKIAQKLKRIITASFILLKPDINLYNDFFKNFVPLCEGKDGYISNNHSGPDETTLLLYYMFYKNIKCYFIPYNYSVVPWEKFPYDKEKVYSIDYLSWIKPWTKIPIIGWDDEIIWYNIAKKLFKKSKKLYELQLDIYIEELLNYINYINSNYNAKKPKYNLEYKNDDRLEKIIEKSKNTDLLKLKYINKYKIIKYLEKNKELKLLIDNSIIYKILKY